MTAHALYNSTKLELMRMIIANTPFRSKAPAAIILSILSLLLWAVSIAAQAQDSAARVTVTVPNGYLAISADDLRLESTGGTVPWKRHWNGQEWKFNGHWESLSQSWKNLTCNQVDIVTLGQTGGYWIWVDEDWTPTPVSAVHENAALPEVIPMEPKRTTPFNRVTAENLTDYPPAIRVAINPSECPFQSNVSQSLEGYRRLNELYLGENGRYVFNNRAALEQQSVRALPTADALTTDAQLATGSITLAPVDIPKGYHWSHKEGDWIDYNLQGQVVAYGDSHDNTVWLVRDDNGVLRGVVDANGRVLFTLHYTGQLLTEVRDYPLAGNAGDLPPRSVIYGYDINNRLTSVTDARGNITYYDYDLQSRLIKITDPEGRIEQFDYIGNAVVKRTAPDGGVTDASYSYDTVKQQFISKITGPETAAGRKWEEFIHNRSGKLLQRLTNGRTDDQVIYDPAARAESHTNARGFTTRLTRSEFEQIVRIDYPDGASIQRSYQASNLRMTEEIDEAGIKTQYEYDSKGNLIRKTEAAGTPDQRITEYQVNERGQITQMTRKGRTEANGTITPDATWLIDYDAQGQISKTTDPEGGVRQYIFDRAGNLVSYTNPLGQTTRFEVDAEGNLVKVTDALDRITTYAYDQVGNLTGLTDARGKQTLAAYDGMNRLFQLTNPAGGSARLHYNAEGLPTTFTDADGRAATAEFDNFQRLIQLSDGLGNQIRFGYHIADGTAAGTLGSLSLPTEINYPTFTQKNRLDQRERPTSETLLHTNHAGTETFTSGTEYDSRGLVKSDTDAAGKQRFYSYDALGQLTEFTDSLGNKTQALYDARGNLIQLTDANGNAHKFEYDRNDRLIRESLPLGQATDYSYDPAGNLIQRLDPNGHKTTHTYDASNWLEEIKQYQGGTQLVRTTGLTWDDAHNLTAWSDTDATRPIGQQTTSGTASYDDDNRKTGETITYPNPTGQPYSLSYSYQYSPAGKKTRLTWADGTAIDYGYSAHGELDSVTIPGEGILSVSQFNWMAPAAVILPGGSVQNKAYDGLLNLEGLKVKSPGQQTLLELSNRYGQRQELTARTRSDTAGGAAGTVTGSFSYDDELRLTQSSTDAGNGQDTETFTLDAVGNRTGHSRVLGDWNYDANNRLTDKGLLLDAVSYDYDEAGNLIRKTEIGQVRQYGYDTRNRLIEVRDGSGHLIARYGYDSFDRRIWKEQYRDRSGNVLAQARRSYYLYADEGLIAESRQDITLDVSESVSASAEPAIASQYGPRPDAAFTTGVLFVKTKNSNGDDTVAYYHHDHLETPIQATDKQGNVVWSAQYNVFGRATITTPMATPDQPTIRSDLRLPGQVEDEETGFHYNWHRYYEPGLGRYVTADPIGLVGGINRYAYVAANPLRYIDPLGLAIDDLPPPPPGYNRSTWEHGTFDNGRYYIKDPNGRMYIAHPEDKGHWRHWDVYPPDDDGKGGGGKKRFPENSKKGWPNQKKYKSDQCPVDPNGDAEPWVPTDEQRMWKEYYDGDPYSHSYPYFSPIPGGGLPRMPSMDRGFPFVRVPVYAP
jgi:RHS repeat-associated protein